MAGQEDINTLIVARDTLRRLREETRKELSTFFFRPGQREKVTERFKRLEAAVRDVEAAFAYDGITDASQASVLR